MNGKRILSLVCCLATLLAVLGGCRNGESNEAPEESLHSESLQTQTVTSDGRSYTDIERRDVKSMETVSFGNSTDVWVLSLYFSEEWSLSEQSDGGYRILRDGEEIGWLRAGEEPIPIGVETVKSAESSVEGVDCDWRLLSDPSEPTAEKQYFHRFVYRYSSGENQRVITVKLGYAELSDFAFRKFIYSAIRTKRTNELGLESIPISPNVAGKPILILGNSFVGSSEIGYSLRAMCEAGGVPHEVKAVSVGYATVSKSWSSYLSSMQSGAYAAVFMCGFYGAEDVAAFGEYVDACRSSNTPIVIFPAHNEGYGANAARSYPDVCYLDWKGEIDSLIISGIPGSAMYVNDAYHHSTPLAGYVGAHMIYRALFGTLPPALSSYGSLSYSYIEQTLGSYAKTGVLEIMDASEVYFLN